MHTNAPSVSSSFHAWLALPPQQMRVSDLRPHTWTNSLYRHGGAFADPRFRSPEWKLLRYTWALVNLLVPPTFCKLSIVIAELSLEGRDGPVDGRCFSIALISGASRYLVDCVRGAIVGWPLRWQQWETLHRLASTRAAWLATHFGGLVCVPYPEKPTMLAQLSPIFHFKVPSSWSKTRETRR